MGYAELTEQKFFSALLSWREAPEREPAVDAMRKRRIVHGASLTWFLIFCKRLFSKPFRFGRLNPKAARPNSTLRSFRIQLWVGSY